MDGGRTPVKYRECVNNPHTREREREEKREREEREREKGIGKRTPVKPQTKD